MFYGSSTFEVTNKIIRKCPYFLLTDVYTRCIYPPQKSQQRPGIFPQIKYTSSILRTREISVPNTASYIRGWIQMVLALNDLFSWNNKYNKYNNYTFNDTFTCFFLSYAHQLTLCMLASRSHVGVVILVLLSSSHVFSLPLSGLNWRPLFPPWGSGPPLSQYGWPIHRVRAHSLTGIRNNKVTRDNILRNKKVQF